MSGVGDQNVKEETFAPVEGRFVKAVFTKADNAVRIYGCRIYGEYSRPFVREGSDVVSIGKTVMKSYDCANERESAINLINGVYEKSGSKWCFYAADINNDPIKFVVIDLEDLYSVNKFTIYDCKLHENNNNLDHYKNQHCYRMSGRKAGNSFRRLEYMLDRSGERHGCQSG